jgi:hypothetical protein
MKRYLLFLPLLALFTPLYGGCQAAVSPGQQAGLSWTQSASCTTAAPCPSYLISRVAVATATTACPATTGTTYTQIAVLSTPNATSYTDSTITATGFYCWTVQAQQGSPLLPGYASPASNSGVALQVTEPPLAPGAPTATAQTAKAEVPAARPGAVPTSAEQLASNGTAPVGNLRAVVR